jgi:hypothetical protein
MAKAESPMVDKDWQSDDDCRALILAQEIMADKPRHRAAMKKAKEKAKALKAVSKENKEMNDA